MRVDKNVSTRRAVATDADVLFAIYASTRREELDAWGWDAGQRSAFLGIQHAAQSRQYSSAYPDAESLIVVVDGAIAGRLLVDRRERATTIVDLALLPEYRGRGIGSCLLTRLQQEGKALELSVFQGNPAARLYARLGFAVVDDSGAYVAMRWDPAGPEGGLG